MRIEYVYGGGVSEVSTVGYSDDSVLRLSEEIQETVLVAQSTACMTHGILAKLSSSVHVELVNDAGSPAEKRKCISSYGFWSICSECFGVFYERASFSVEKRSICDGACARMPLGESVVVSVVTHSGRCEESDHAAGGAI